jgi:hypothetical protein
MCRGCSAKNQSYVLPSRSFGTIFAHYDNFRTISPHLGLVRLIPNRQGSAWIAARCRVSSRRGFFPARRILGLRLAPVGITTRPIPSNSSLLVLEKNSPHQTRGKNIHDARERERVTSAWATRRRRRRRVNLGDDDAAPSPPPPVLSSFGHVLPGTFLLLLLILPIS